MLHLLLSRILRNLFFIHIILFFQGLPIGAVKNAMQRDGLDPSIIDLDHNKSVSSQLNLGDQKDNDPPLKEDPKVFFVSALFFVSLFDAILIDIIALRFDSSVFQIF